MTLQHATERGALVEAGRELVRRGLSHGTTGNLSVRVGDAALVKPTNVLYEAMRPEDVPLVALKDGRVLDAPSGAAPSSELLMHLEVLRARPDVGAVAHGHPPHATALAAARKPIPAFLDEVVAFLGGQVEVSEYAPSGTPLLAANVARALGARGAALVASHGAVGVGRNLREAVEALALCEEAARVYVLALAAGGPAPLPPGALSHWRSVYAKGERRY